MPTTLRRDGDEMRLKLAGLSTEEFQDALSKARAVSGKRWDGEAKEWVYPFTPENAMRLVHTIRVDADEEVLDLIRDHAAKVAGDLASKVPDDAALSAPWNDRMFPYQRSGTVFMVENKTVLLADDMGTGKTVQATTAVLESRYTTESVGMPRALVVTPNSVKHNWAHSVELGPRYKGQILFPEWEGPEVTVLDGSSKQRRIKQLANATGWVVVNWEALREGGLLEPLMEQSFDAIIADEAHRAKNYKAAQTKGLHKLHASMRLALTGTPILNSPEELWGPLCWLDPETWGSEKTSKCTSSAFWSFYYRHVHFFEGYYGKVVTGVRNPDDLRFALKHTLIRRTKSQVLKDLPKKLPPQTIEVELYPEQRKLYKQFENELWVTIEQAIEGGEIAPEAVKAALDSEDPAKIEALTLMVPNAAAKYVRLRQVSTSPALLGGKDKSAKFDAALDIMFDNADKQFVVFTHFKDSARLLAERVNRRAKDENAAVYFTGDTPDRERDDLAEAFQRGDHRVLAATIMAGGQGIDLYAADTAIFVEREWTPGYNQQAEDRLHRQGQKNVVTIIRLDALDTLDVGKIAPANRLKELIVASVVGVA